jgi:hypothetical protein
MGIACAVMSQPSIQGINGAYADSTSVESQSIQSSSDTFDTELSVTRLREFPTSLRQIPRDESIQQSRAIDSSLERRGSIAASWTDRARGFMVSIIDVTTSTSICVAR